MEVYACWLGVAFIFGLLAGIVFGISAFGEKPPVGTLKIRYDETEKDPYMFLELWEEAGDITAERTVNLVVSVAYSKVKNYIAQD